MLPKEENPVIKSFAAALVLAVLSCAGAPAAVIYNETEPNNTWATANVIAGHDGTLIINGSRVGDSTANYFRFPAVPGLFTGTVCCSGDPMLALFDPAGNMVAADDDSGPGLMPYIWYSIPTAGMWTVAVTGWPDWGFGGGGSTNWPYQATLTFGSPANSEIPEPGTWGLLAAGLVGVFAFRRLRG